MRFLIGLVLMPIMALIVMAVLTGIVALINPTAFFFVPTPIAVWLEGLTLGMVVFCSYAAPTALILLPLVDRIRPLDLSSAALLSAVGGVATVLSSIPLRPQISGFALANKTLAVALLVAAICGGMAGAIFVACRRRFIKHETPGRI